MTLDSTRYNEVRQKSSHNAFQRREGIYDQIMYWRIRSLELDLHRGDVKGDWDIYHEWWDRDSTVEHLKGFLRICRGVQRAMSRHEVITVFLDAKEAFHKTSSASHSAVALDELVRERLGEDRIFTPGDLMARSQGATTLREAVVDHGWPTLRELRGKFLLVLTGSPETLATYATAGVASQRAAFVSANVSAAKDVPSADDHIVFYNFNAANVRLGKRVDQEGFVSRAYYVNSRKQWQRAKKYRCHHIATDKVNERVDSWSRTRRDTGYPFQLLEGATPRVTERGEVCGLAARSGDLWGERDSFFFHFREWEDSLAHTYELLVSGSNSHVDNWVKGGLIARESLKAGSPYFGVFRVGEHHGLRVQYRLKEGGPTIAAERPITLDGAFDADTLAHLKLRVLRDGRRARAWGSADGKCWTEIATHDFKKRLKFHGMGVSSHDEGGGAKFLFGVPEGRPRPDFDRARLIGSRSKSDFGWHDWDDRSRWKVDRFSAIG